MLKCLHRKNNIHNFLPQRLYASNVLHWCFLSSFTFCQHNTLKMKFYQHGIIYSDLFWETFIWLSNSNRGFFLHQGILYILLSQDIVFTLFPKTLLKWEKQIMKDHYCGICSYKNSSNEWARTRMLKKWQKATFVTSLWFCVINRWETWGDIKNCSSKPDAFRRGENWVISEKSVAEFFLFFFSRTVQKRGKEEKSEPFPNLEI